MFEGLWTDFFRFSRFATAVKLHSLIPVLMTLTNIDSHEEGESENFFAYYLAKFLNNQKDDRYAVQA